MLLIQFTAAAAAIQVGLLDPADNHRVLPLAGVPSTHALALQAIGRGLPLAALVASCPHEAALDYDRIVADGRLLPPLTHPDPAHCLVSGTGLTHLGSAESRNAMHEKLARGENLTDSLKMFRLGLEGGKPPPGQAGVAPEWFYKGDGSTVRASGQALEMPDFALDGGEETELVGLYVVAPDGTPCRLGFALGNEFSDHVLEQQNYLYLAHSKLRPCALGPALRLGPLPQQVDGVTRLRDAQGHVRWSKPFVSGEAHMSHSIANLEHHHFKYPLFRRPGDVHLHFLGAATLSFADGIRATPGECWEIEAPAFGPALVSPLARARAGAPPVRAL